jgi:hypothetical protein
VERRDRDGLGGVPAALRLQQRLRPLAHLARGLVRERDREDARGVGTPLHEVRDLRGDHARLAAARAGEHEQRAVDVAHRVALRGVQGKRHRGCLRRDRC